MRLRGKIKVMCFVASSSVREWSIMMSMSVCVHACLREHSLELQVVSCHMHVAWGCGSVVAMYFWFYA